MLSPIATLILVVVTLAGALPVYCIVARESPNGQGSVAMLERMLPGWQGKVLVLLLLGFAATAFIITITLSAADATAHIVENPILAEFLKGQRVPVTLLLLALLGALFLKGFSEAIGLSFFIVAAYLTLSAVILVNGMYNLVWLHPPLISAWQTQIFREYSSLPMMFGVGMLLFPKLALGLSGFETGVAVMPLVKGYATDTAEKPEGRIKNARLLLITAAAIMSVFLTISSIVTTMLIPASYFQEGGPANGRALAYLAHTNLGHVFGTVYDISTILILWFAGASAIAGLLTLVPKYLPRYGMAPSWSAATRPLVVFFTTVAFVVTIIFKADVDAQAAAYATGVLVLITSAAIAASISVWHKAAAARIYFCFITFVFIYTAFANMSERNLYGEILSSMIAKRDKLVARSNAASFYTNGALWAVGEAFDIPTYRVPKLSIPSGTVSILAGVVPSFFSLWAMHQYNGKKIQSENEPNMLAKLFDYPISGEVDYPSSVLAFLDTVPPDNASKKTRKDQLIDRWLSDQNIPSFTDRKNKKLLDAITAAVSQQKGLSIDTLSARQDMLQQLAGEVMKMKRMLLELSMASTGEKSL